MMRTGFLFAGQGAQSIGMARDLYEAYPLVKEIYDTASDVLGYDLREVIDTDEAKLQQTRYTQPAILTTSFAIYRLLEVVGITPDMVAGLSLGEYTALVAAGSLSFEEAVALVAKRGSFMEEAAPAGSGKMVAILNTDAALIEAVCQEASCLGVVAPANYNTPQQIVIGGTGEAVDKAVALLSEKGVTRMIPLNVSGPFHTALLRPASEKLRRVLETIDFQPPRVPVIGNTSAASMSETDMPDLLSRQVMEPVRFYESIDRMTASGVTRFIEIGPGKVLTGFMKRIAKGADLYQVDTLESLHKLEASYGH